MRPRARDPDRWVGALDATDENDGDDAADNEDSYLQEFSAFPSTDFLTPGKLNPRRRQKDA